MCIILLNCNMDNIISTQDKYINTLLRIKRLIICKIDFLGDLLTSKRDLDTEMCEIIDTFLFSDLEDYKDVFDEKKIKTEIVFSKQYLKKIEEKIKNNCQHEFVEDHIDYSIDKSKKINYCRKCLFEKNYV